MNTLAIVILNYNGKGYLEKFLPNVIEHSKGHEIIVADNCSTDDSVAFMKEKHPDIQLIELKENGGFAKGYNQALAQVKSDFYLLLNSDIEVTENWCEKLLETLQDETVAGVQPKVLAYDNKSHFEHAGASGGFLDRDYFPYCRGRIFEITEEDTGQYQEPTEVFWATGASLLIRSKVFHEVGGFDEDFFAHMEEIDLCWRAKRRGWKFMVNPEAVVYHVGGGTLSYASPFKTYLNFRNSLFMLIKNHEGPLFIKWLIRMCLDGVAGARFLVLGETKQLKALWEAHRDMYKKLGKMLKKRKELKAFSTQFNAAGLSKKSILVQRYIHGKTHYSDL
ncbi:MAG: glycosyltransferase family 2 protein [Crocinitomicaceae bacterium]|nr:glycosyltransferase family 2 protein [Crocinitomicaceae bacterium]